MALKGIVAFVGRVGIMLQGGIGDAIRISLTPEPAADSNA